MHYELRALWCKYDLMQLEQHDLTYALRAKYDHKYLERSMYTL